jgi:catechol 2,3-dioxygenase-like lactoylglutathione lyase family enzyme
MPIGATEHGRHNGYNIDRRPGHGGDGALHVAFAIGKDELSLWETHLASQGVVIEGRNDWERGGHSIYFRDPDGHLLELATPGLWPVY